VVVIVNENIRRMAKGVCLRLIGTTGIKEGGGGGFSASSVCFSLEKESRCLM